MDAPPTIPTDPVPPPPEPQARFAQTLYDLKCGLANTSLVVGLALAAIVVTILLLTVVGWCMRHGLEYNPSENQTYTKWKLSGDFLFVMTLVSVIGVTGSAALMEKRIIGWRIFLVLACCCALVAIPGVIALPRTTFVVYATSLIFAILCCTLAIGGKHAIKIYETHALKQSWKERELEAHRCPACGYSIASLVVPRCPECGASLPEHVIGAAGNPDQKTTGEC